MPDNYQFGYDFERGRMAYRRRLGCLVVGPLLLIAFGGIAWEFWYAHEHPTEGMVTTIRDWHRPAQPEK